MIVFSKCIELDDICEIKLYFILDSTLSRFYKETNYLNIAPVPGESEA